MTTTKLLFGISSLATLWLGSAARSTSASDLKVARVDPRVPFTKDAQGKVTSLVRRQRGDREAKKTR